MKLAEEWAAAAIRAVEPAETAPTKCLARHRIECSQGPQSVALLSGAYPVLDINWIVSSAPRAADQETAFLNGDCPEALSEPDGLLSSRASQSAPQMRPRVLPHEARYGFKLAA
jgi:hypothetical protein